MLKIACEHRADPATVASFDPAGRDRRRHARHPLRLRADARRLDNTLLARRDPKLSLTIINISEGGLYALTRSPVETGERLAVLLPPDWSGTTRRVFGRVIRCDPTDNGWEIAMQFALVPAA